MASLGSLTYDVVADVSKFDKGLTKAEQIARRRSQSIRRVFGGIAAAVGAIGVGRLITSVAETSDEIDKLSIRLGVSTEALSQLRFAADLSGVSFQTLTLAIQRSTRRISEAAQNTGEAQNALKELGLNASELTRLAPDKQLEVLADAFLEVEGSADRVRLAMKLFDSEGVAMLQVLERGGAGLRAMRDEADSLGLTLTSTTVAQMVEFRDTMTRIQAISQGLVRTLVSALGPAIVRAAEAFAKGVKWAASFLDKLREIENQTNTQNLRDELSRLNERAIELRESLSFEQAQAGGRRGAAGRARVQALLDIEDQIDRVQSRLAELDAQASSVGVFDPSLTTGVGATDRERADQAAAERAAAEAEAQRQQLQQRLDAIRQSFLTEQELLMQSLVQKQDIINEAFANELITKEQQLALLEDLEVQYNRRLVQSAVEAAKQKAQAEQQQMRQREQNFRSLLSSAATTSRALFNINKAFALANAVLSFQEAVAGAYAVGARIGGPAVGAVYAGIAAAAQVARIAAIASTSFGGGSAGSSAGAGGGAVPVAPGDPNFGFAGQAQPTETRTEVTINFGNQQLFSADQVRTLIEAINEQIDDGVVVGNILVA